MDLEQQGQDPSKKKQQNGGRVSPDMMSLLLGGEGGPPAMAQEPAGGGQDAGLYGAPSYTAGEPEGGVGTGTTHYVADMAANLLEGATFSFVPRETGLRMFASGVSPQMEDNPAYWASIERRINEGGFSGTTQRALGSAFNMVGMSVPLVIEAMLTKRLFGLGGLGKKLREAQKAYSAAKAAKDEAKAYAAAEEIQRLTKDARLIQKIGMGLRQGEAGSTLGKIGIEGAHTTMLLSLDHALRGVAKEVSPYYDLSPTEKQYLQMNPGAVVKGKRWDPDAHEARPVYPDGSFAPTGAMGIVASTAHSVPSSAMLGFGSGILSAITGRVLGGMANRFEAAEKEAFMKKLGEDHPAAPPGALMNAWQSYRVSPAYHARMWKKVYGSAAGKAPEYFQAIALGTALHKFDNPDATWGQSFKYGGLPFVLAHAGNSAMWKAVSKTPMAKFMSPIHLSPEESKTLEQVFKDTEDEWRRQYGDAYDAATEAAGEHLEGKGEDGGQEAPAPEVGALAKRYMEAVGKAENPEEALSILEAAHGDDPVAKNAVELVRKNLAKANKEEGDEVAEEEVPEADYETDDAGLPIAPDKDEPIDEDLGEEEPDNEVDDFEPDADAPLPPANAEGPATKAQVAGSAYEVWNRGRKAEEVSEDDRKQIDSLMKEAWGATKEAANPKTLAEKRKDAEVRLEGILGHLREYYPEEGEADVAVNYIISRKARALLRRKNLTAETREKWQKVYNSAMDTINEVLGDPRDRRRRRKAKSIDDIRATMEAGGDNTRLSGSKGRSGPKNKEKKEELRVAGDVTVHNGIEGRWVEVEEYEPVQRREHTEEDVKKWAEEVREETDKGKEWAKESKALAEGFRELVEIGDYDGAELVLEAYRSMRDSPRGDMSKHKDFPRNASRYLAEVRQNAGGEWSLMGVLGAEGAIIERNAKLIKAKQGHKLVLTQSEREYEEAKAKARKKSSKRMEFVPTQRPKAGRSIPPGEKRLYYRKKEAETLSDAYYYFFNKGEEDAASRLDEDTLAEFGGKDDEERGRKLRSGLDGAIKEREKRRDELRADMESAKLDRDKKRSARIREELSGVESEIEKLERAKRDITSATDVAERLKAAMIAMYGGHGKKAKNHPKFPSGLPADLKAAVYGKESEVQALKDELQRAESAGGKKKAVDALERLKEAEEELETLKSALNIIAGREENLAAIRTVKHREFNPRLDYEEGPKPFKGAKKVPQSSTVISADFKADFSEVNVSPENGIQVSSEAKKALSRAMRQALAYDKVLDTIESFQDWADNLIRNYTSEDGGTPDDLRRMLKRHDSDSPRNEFYQLPPDILKAIRDGLKVYDEALNSAEELALTKGQYMNLRDGLVAMYTSIGDADVPYQHNPSTIDKDGKYFWVNIDVPANKGRGSSRGEWAVNILLPVKVAEIGGFDREYSVVISNAEDFVAGLSTSVGKKNKFIPALAMRTSEGKIAIFSPILTGEGAEMGAWATVLETTPVVKGEGTRGISTVLRQSGLFGRGAKVSPRLRSMAQAMSGLWPKGFRGDSGEARAAAYKETVHGVAEKYLGALKKASDVEEAGDIIAEMVADIAKEGGVYEEAEDGHIFTIENYGPATGTRLFVKPRTVETDNGFIIHYRPTQNDKPDEVGRLLEIHVERDDGRDFEAHEALSEVAQDIFGIGDPDEEEAYLEALFGGEGEDGDYSEGANQSRRILASLLRMADIGLKERLRDKLSSASRSTVGAVYVLNEGHKAEYGLVPDKRRSVVRRRWVATMEDRIKQYGSLEDWLLLEDREAGDKMFKRVLSSMRSNGSIPDGLERKTLRDYFDTIIETISFGLKFDRYGQMYISNGINSPLLGREGSLRERIAEVRDEEKALKDERKLAEKEAKKKGVELSKHAIATFRNRSRHLKDKRQKLEREMSTAKKLAWREELVNQVLLALTGAKSASLKDRSDLERAEQVAASEEKEKPKEKPEKK